MLKDVFTRSNLLLLRIPFSFFLLPVFTFSLSQAGPVYWPTAISFFVLLHLLVYPASNAYNSYMDQDEGSIGGLERPPKAQRSLYILSLFLDAIGLLVALSISWQLAVQVVLYIAASKLYSWRVTRIKRYPIGSFLLVATFQGGATYLMGAQAIANRSLTEVLTPATYWAMLTATLLVGAVYPLTQVYQHTEDRARGDCTLSLLLGIKGTFAFSSLLFVLGGSCMAYYFTVVGKPQHFLLLNIFMLPVVVYFVFWVWQVLRDVGAANWRNTMRMNTLAGACLTTGFLYLWLLH